MTSDMSNQLGRSERGSVQVDQRGSLAGDLQKQRHRLHRRPWGQRAAGRAWWPDFPFWMERWMRKIQVLIIRPFCDFHGRKIQLSELWNMYPEVWNIHMHDWVILFGRCW